MSSSVVSDSVLGLIIVAIVRDGRDSAELGSMRLAKATCLSYVLSDIQRKMLCLWDVSTVQSVLESSSDGSSLLMAGIVLWSRRWEDTKELLRSTRKQKQFVCILYF